MQRAPLGVWEPEGQTRPLKYPSGLSLTQIPLGEMKVLTRRP